MNKDSDERQVVSRQRVNDYGEVYTAEREVNAMLDLVKAETERIDSRFLEPACGTGNFLIEIQRRKLNVVEQRYSRSQYEYDMYAAQAISSSYGVELLMDNTEHCRQRLFDDFECRYQRIFGKMSEKYERCIKYLLNKNIICGDALSMLDNADKPIIFCEWTFLGNGKVQRRDFQFDKLMVNVEFDPPKKFEEGLLFSDIGEPTFIHDPIKEYPVCNYLNIPDYD